MTYSSFRFPLLTLTLIAAAPGCGGSDQVNGNSADLGGFDAAGYPKNSTGGTNGGLPPGGPGCGNGAADQDEQCDGYLLKGNTCATATMGSMPGGVLKCLSNCTLDTSGCTTNGNPPGAGGNTATGGGTGAGGRVGAGGA